MARVLAVVCVLALSSVLAGCVEEGGELTPFESLGAPAWEAGYNWTWDGAQSGTWTFSGEEGSRSSSGSESQQITHTVVNTERPAFDQPVYWVRATGELDSDGPMEDGAFSNGGLQAFAQSDLQLVGHATQNHYPGSWAECGNSAISLVRAEAFPFLRFPLERGATWQGEVDEGVTVRAEVLGATEVVLPAGTFDTVEVRLDVEVDPAIFDEAEVLAFSSSTTVWYAEEVRNIVRLESHTDLRIQEDGEGEMRMQTESSMELLSFSLVAGVEEELPQLMYQDDRIDEFNDPVSAVLIASDVRFPINGAEGVTEVTFGLTSDMEAPDAGGSGIRLVEEVPKHLPWLDAENETLRWTFWTPDDQVTLDGTTVTYALPEAGTVAMHVAVVPVDMEVADEQCIHVKARPISHEHATGPRMLHAVPSPGRLLADAWFSVEWHEEFSVQHTGPLPERHHVMDVPVAMNGQLTATYTQPPSSLLGEAGRLIAVFPNGAEWVLDEGGVAVGPQEAGVAQIFWDARSGWSPVALAHEVRGSIDVSY